MAAWPRRSRRPGWAKCHDDLIGGDWFDLTIYSPTPTNRRLWQPVLSIPFHLVRKHTSTPLQLHSEFLWRFLPSGLDVSDHVCQILRLEVVLQTFWHQRKARRRELLQIAA